MIAESMKLSHGRYGHLGLDGLLKTYTGCARLNVTTLRWHTRPLVRLSDIRGSWHGANMGHFTYQHFLHKWTSEQSSRAENRTIRLVIAFRVFFGCPNSRLFDPQNLILVDILSIPGFPRLQILDSQDLDDQQSDSWESPLRIPLENPPWESTLRIPLENPPGESPLRIQIQSNSNPNPIQSPIQLTNQI